uniref:Uncharacterized protein n=1 Tax=Euglena hiemalis TaxID=392896 RepID=A0A345UC54_9EUGL|nr:hypothetical protein [Euglena hiemalis]AXI98040.1 hypothetical protein [Euglena hiemalis]
MKKKMQYKLARKLWEENIKKGIWGSPPPPIVQKKPNLSKTKSFCKKLGTVFTYIYQIKDLIRKTKSKYPIKVYEIILNLSKNTGVLTSISKYITQIEELYNILDKKLGYNNSWKEEIQYKNNTINIKPIKYKIKYITKKTNIKVKKNLKIRNYLSQVHFKKNLQVIKNL